MEVGYSLGNHSRLDETNSLSAVGIHWWSSPSGQLSRDGHHSRSDNGQVLQLTLFLVTWRAVAHGRGGNKLNAAERGGNKLNAAERVVVWQGQICRCGTAALCIPEALYVSSGIETWQYSTAVDRSAA